MAGALEWSSRKLPRDDLFLHASRMGDKEQDGAPLAGCVDLAQWEMFHCAFDMKGEFMRLMRSSRLLRKTHVGFAQGHDILHWMKRALQLLPDGVKC